jgi:geranylgeranyl diphosphate synthase type I
VTQDISGPAARDLFEYVATTLAATDEILDAVCSQLEEEWRLRSPEPIDVLQDDLPAMLRSRLLPAPGKRLRPVMCHWGWVSARGASDEDGHEALAEVAAALELLHLFALVHDDVMDRSDSRRGRPTAHLEARIAHEERVALGDPAVFGDGIAVLLGDLALSEAGLLVSGASQAVRDQWRAMLRELVHGQSLDLTAAAGRRRDLTLARRVARLKSGSYTIQRPLLIGASIAGAGPAVSKALSAYGEHLGEAFALRDDVLGIWGDARTTGKPVGDDLVSGKPTVVLAAARRLLPDALSRRYLGPDAVVTEEDVPVLQQLFVDWGVLDEVEERIADEATAALDSLDAADLPPAGLAGLREMVRVTAWRDA